MESEQMRFYDRDGVNEHVKQENVDNDGRDRSDRGRGGDRIDRGRGDRNDRERGSDRNDRDRGSDRNDRDKVSDRRDRDRGNERRDRDRVDRNDRDGGRENRKSSEKHERRRSRDRGKDRNRDKSPDRRREKREPSAESKKAYKYWDVPPTGYENIAPAEFKAMQAAGQVLPTMYTTEDSGINLSTETHMSMGNAVSRQNRRIYVGNIPLGITEQGMMDFFNEQLKTTASVEGDPVIAVQINADKNFAFLEFRSVDETNQGLSLDGIMYNGFPLKLKRPRDYVALPAEFMNLSSVSGIVQDTPHKLFVGGLPHYLNEEQVKELLVNFGQLSGFNLVKDATTGLSKGYAFCEYADHSVTDQACMGLTGIQLGDKRIVVQRASLGNKNPSSMPGAALMLARTQQMTINPALGPAGQETEILCLHNMIAAEDLVDDDEYEEIVEDIKDECGKYGHVVSVQIPRPSSSGYGGHDVGGGVGKVFVEFGDKAETVKAMKALAGRTFSGRVVVASFYEPDKYRNGFF